MTESAITPAALHERFPVLNDTVAEEILRSAVRKTFPKGAVLYEQGFPCTLVPLILSGVVRVYKLGDSGREVTLYRVGPGETCILSTSCGVSGASYPAIAVAEEDLDMLAVPAHVFRELTLRYPDLQRFISDSLAERLSEIMTVVEELAFRRVDLRLAEMLEEAAEASDSPTINKTHAQLAVELGTAREVVSRILKEFEHRGYVHLGRGHIGVLHPGGLRDYQEQIKQRAREAV